MMRTERWLGWLVALIGALASAALLATAAVASDGGSAAPEPPPEEGGGGEDGGEGGGEGGDAMPLSLPGDPSGAPTYYEATLGAVSSELLADASPELPSALTIDDATARAEYVAVAEVDGRTEWEVRIEDFARRHERVDAIYDMVLLLPMPVAPDGRDAFRPLERGVRIEEGSAGRSVPLVYGGEKVVLKRNIGLEKALLPRLVGAAGIPDLAGTGLRWTAWDTIVRRDPLFGDTVRVRAALRFSTPAGTPAPDADDPRVAAWVITWIPALPAHVPPYAVRVDVRAPDAL